MSGVVQNTLHDSPGPLDDQECNHRGQLPRDPPPEFTQHCEEIAVFAVPHPNGLGQCLALCPWHLERYLDAYPQKAQRLTERFDSLEDRRPDVAWLGLDDLPPQTTVSGEDDRWQLLALDQRGYAYYVDSLDAVSAVALYAPGDWKQYDEFISVPESATVRDVCDRIADVHGLAALPKTVRERCARGEGGG
jgi:hypothetical protein